MSEDYLEKNVRFTLTYTTPSEELLSNMPGIILSTTLLVNAYTYDFHCIK